jgi:hypothetical protein
MSGLFFGSIIEEKKMSNPSLNFHRVTKVEIKREILSGSGTNVIKIIAVDSDGDEFQLNLFTSETLVDIVIEGDSPTDKPG